MKVAIKHDIVLKNGKPSAAIISYNDFLKMIELIQSISKKPTVRKMKPIPDEIAILKIRKKEKSIPMDVFFKKLENA